MPAIRFNVFIAVLLAAGLLAPQAWAASEVSGTTALAVYYDNSSSPNIAKNRFWNYSNASWNSPASALALNESEALAWVDLKANPTRDEYVLVAITNSSRAIASVYSNGAWGNELVLSTVTNYSQWGASVVFEHQSGDAIVVWNNGSADVPYAVWNGASWSAFSSILPDSCTAGANWTFLFPRFNSDEAILAYSDGQGRLCGQHWNGSAWDSQSNFENVTTAFADLGRFFSGAFEYSSGRAIVVWESSNGSSSNNGNINYANWTGSGWSARGRASNDVGSENDWISCDSQKSAGQQASNIVVCVSTEDTGSSSGDVNVGQWNGTEWVDDKWHSLDGSAESDGPNAAFADVAFVGQTKRLSSRTLTTTTIFRPSKNATPARTATREAISTRFPARWRSAAKRRTRAFQRSFPMLSPTTPSCRGFRKTLGIFCRRRFARFLHCIQAAQPKALGAGLASQRFASAFRLDNFVFKLVGRRLAAFAILVRIQPHWRFRQHHAFTAFSKLLVGEFFDND
ncbi:hypothetical protein J4220_04115 [Candidatus Micrarchaeota archaeon]|nr:hypothetical protein [Candidatus Micrarchaeota archaeon]